MSRYRHGQKVSRRLVYGLIPRVLTVVLILYSYFEILHRVPPLTLTHSHAAGNFANPLVAVTLWILLLIQVLGSGLFLAVPYVARSFPEAVHFGWTRLSDDSPKQRERIMPLLRDMMGLMSCVFSLHFAVLIHWLIGNAISARPRPPAWWLPAGLLAGEGAIVLYYLGKFNNERR